MCCIYLVIIIKRNSTTSVYKPVDGQQDLTLQPATSINAVRIYVYIYILYIYNYIGYNTSSSAYIPARSRRVGVISDL